MAGKNKNKNKSKNKTNQTEKLQSTPQADKNNSVQIGESKNKSNVIPPVETCEVKKMPKRVEADNASPLDSSWSAEVRGVLPDGGYSESKNSSATYTKAEKKSRSKQCFEKDTKSYDEQESNSQNDDNYNNSFGKRNSQRKSNSSCKYSNEEDFQKKNNTSFEENWPEENWDDDNFCEKNKNTSQQKHSYRSDRHSTDSRNSRNYKVNVYDTSSDFDSSRSQKSFNNSRSDSSFNQSYSKGVRRSSKERDDDDKEFDEFLDVLKLKKQLQLAVQERNGDLFEMSDEYALAHCVAEDMNMGSGIAVTFRQNFKNVAELLDQQQHTGGLAILNCNGRFIYYLVTKKRSSGKPKMVALCKSLQKMRKHIIENGVKKLAMPRIGCGLDRLEWQEVKLLIEFLFKEVDVELVVCNFQQDEEASGSMKKFRKAKVVDEVYPLIKIAEMTMLLYFGTVDGSVNQQINELDQTFGSILNNYKQKRELGAVVRTAVRGDKYVTYGCIVKQKETDRFSFIAFQKCLMQIKKYNKKDQYYYIGFQPFKDRSDNMITEKIINLLRNTLFDVDVYVCWTGEMLQFMPKSIDK